MDHKINRDSVVQVSAKIFKQEVLYQTKPDNVSKKKKFIYPNTSILQTCHPKV